MMMHHAGMQYEEVFHDPAKWPQEQKTMPNGVMPVMEFPNGEKMGQTCSMARWIGKMHGYHPEDPMEAWASDAWMEDHNDQLVGPMSLPLLAIAEKKGPEEVK